MFILLNSNNDAKAPVCPFRPLFALLPSCRVKKGVVILTTTWLKQVVKTTTLPHSWESLFLTSFCYDKILL